MKKCGNCKREYTPDKKKCAKCGTTLELTDGYVCHDEDHYCSDTCLLEQLESNGASLDAYPEEK